MISKQEHIDDWNTYVKEANPTWVLSLGAFVSKSADADGSRAAVGDPVYRDYCMLRSRMTASEFWPMNVRAFGEKFREWRSLSSLMDFSDLIESAMKNQVPAPFNPDTIFVDEAQDHDRLELSLLRQWSSGVDRIVICGDPDQNLYSWRGAEPEAFYATEIPDSHYIVLSQSYRVPRKVHAIAQRLIGRVKERRPVVYHPRDVEGECRTSHLRLRADYEVAAEAEKIAAGGRSVMILASCEYMLSGLIQFLRQAGIPFHNPYATNRGSFNPLGDRNGVSSPQRLLAFLRADERYCEDARRWTWSEFAAWVDPLDVAGLLRRGAKKRVEDLGRQRAEQVVDGGTLRELLDPAGGAECLAASRENPLGWYRARLNKSRAAAFDFPLAVCQRRGVRALTEKPKIILGTIHSVKGGEAEVVMVFPDLSPQGAETFGGDPDAIWRLFYVAATRAKEELILCSSSSGVSVGW